MFSLSPKHILKLVKLVEERDIDELEVSRWGHKIRITKRKPHGDSSPESDASIQLKDVQPEDADVGKEAEVEAPSNLVEVMSPMVGTFYRASASGAEPYVTDGSEIKVGQVLCIIEAMKLMNEIESEHNGKIAKILVENAEPVEYNQALFLIEEQ